MNRFTYHFGVNSYLDNNFVSFLNLKKKISNKINYLVHILIIVYIIVN